MNAIEANSQTTERPIDVSFPSIKRFEAGNTGVSYVFRFDSGKPGPRAMICALTHGNEVCGAIALAALLDHEFRPRKGTLTLSFNNVAAYERFDVREPDRARYIDEDFNRVWSDDKLENPHASSERTRAVQLRPFVNETDALLDLHSMHEPCAPLWVVGARQKNVAFARRIREDIACVVDQGHPAGVRMRDYGAFDDETAPQVSVLIECGQHWDARAPVVAIDAVARFLVTTGLAHEEDFPSPWRTPLAAPAGVFEVTHAIVPATQAFRFTKSFRGLERLLEGEIFAYDGEMPIRSPHDDCVLIMPSLRHARPGVTVVRLAREYES